MKLLNKHLVLEIKHLLKEGKLSQRKIAKHLGVARSTVSIIAKDTWPGFKQRTLSTDSPFTGPFKRCPGCGGMVQMPCHTCYIRSLK